MFRFSDTYNCGMAVEHDNFNLQLQHNNSLLLFREDKYNDDVVVHVEFDKFIGFVYPKYDKIGVFGKIDFMNSEVRDLYLENQHSIKFNPLGNWIYNFDTNTCEEYTLYGINMIVQS